MDTTPNDGPLTPVYVVTSTEPVAGVQAARKKRRTMFFVIGGATALALCMGGGGIALGASITAANNADAIAASGTTDTVLPGAYQPTSPFGGDSNTYGGGQSYSGGTGTDSGTGSGTGSPSSSTATESTATAATVDQKLGVVTIVSDLYYSETSQSAGTGIVLTSDGQILTNNHVIEGSTSIEVTVESTGETYQATVVGTDAVDDVAVLQLVDASGLTTATIDEDALAVADAVTSVGNAEGTGDLVAAAGTVTALDQDITVGSESTGTSESLTGLIQIDADVVSGDSGGPLVDAEGEVTGIVTAASSGTADIVGYAIPIDTALSIATRILSGDESGNVSIGAPAFLGVQLATEQTAAGVILGGAIEGTPAASAGLVAGDVITAFDGVAVTTVDELSAAVALHEVGDSATVTYTSADGTSQTVTVTLMAGPAA
ncbi:S1-C subfamily serine protease [Conyzicola lurida]|uniref:S1-C subfamily serine protease n=1 Tax=Conyzicola lurida TaxID=1172621 RepID=A0A841ALC3_9MICO|nr:trypsin-like peptidase domain-containing protein [Conyzicola lurida]MBB5842772.1 S1-C subfamily serine protease [Conyzicola lurida]